MSVKIGHASIDEYGKVSGGKVGDQTGKEICIREWYPHNPQWNVYLVCTDQAIAKKAAEINKQICNDPNYGYDQLQRLTGYNAILKNNKKVKGAKGEFDCSSLVAACYILAGLNLSPSLTTTSLRKALLATGKFKAYTDKAHIGSDAYATPGSLYLREGYHVVMALEHGSKSNPYPVPERNINLGCEGEDVKWVQWELLAHGIRYVTVNGKKEELTVDGSCGKITETAIGAYQQSRKLKFDKDCGPITRGSLTK